MITINNYVKAASLEEAWQLNQKPKNRVLGGMLWLKMGNRLAQTAIDLSGLGLDTIEETDEEFRIGCMATLRQFELHEGLDAYTNGMAREAVRHIVGVQFRNCATVGGSVYGRFGFSDVLTILLSMDSYVELYKGGIVPMAEFANMPYDNDILVRVIIKKTPAKFAYLSVRPAKTDFPTLACAASVSADGAVKVSVGARPMKAMLVDDGGILDGGLTAESIRAFADHAAQNVPTASNIRGSAAYRTHLVRVLTTRALTQLGGEQEC